jgi:hypothetical protein
LFETSRSFVVEFLEDWAKAALDKGRMHDGVGPDEFAFLERFFMGSTRMAFLDR